MPFLCERNALAVPVSLSNSVHAPESDTAAPSAVASFAVILFAAAVFVYRRYLVEYRYILTDRMISIDQVVGKKIRNAELLHLSDILSITEGEWGQRGVRRLASYGRDRYLSLIVQNAGKKYEVLISPTSFLEEKLLETWKTAKK